MRVQGVDFWLPFAIIYWYTRRFWVSVGQKTAEFVDQLGFDGSGVATLKHTLDHTTDSEGMTMMMAPRDVLTDPHVHAKWNDDCAAVRRFFEEYGNVLPSEADTIGSQTVTVHTVTITDAEYQSLIWMRVYLIARTKKLPKWASPLEVEENEEDDDYEPYNPPPMEFPEPSGMAHTFNPPPSTTTGAK